MFTAKNAEKFQTRAQENGKKPQAERSLKHPMRPLTIRFLEMSFKLVIITLLVSEAHAVSLKTLCDLLHAMRHRCVYWQMW